MVLNLALKNLTRKKVRTILTIIGITVAISFTIGLLSVSEGFILSFNKTLQKRGVDIFVGPKIADSSPFPMFTGLLGSKGKLPRDYVNKLAELNNVELVVPVKVVVGMMDFIPGNLPLVVDGVPTDLLPKFKSYCKLSKGRLLNSKDKKALLMGYAAAKDRNIEVGDKIDIYGEEFQVVGIFEQLGTLADWKIYAPLKVIQELFGEKGKIDYIMIKLKDIHKVKETLSEVQTKFPELTSYPLEEVISHLKEMLSIARAVHLSIASFALLVGIFFVASTQVWSIQERIKEFATLRVIGASKSIIFKIVILESIILCLLSGILGDMGGLLLSKGINYFLQRFLGVYHLQTFVSLKLFIYGILIAVIIGGIAGIFPARVIASQNMAESLKYE